MVRNARDCYVRGPGFDSRQTQEFSRSSQLLFGGLANHQESIYCQENLLKKLPKPALNLDKSRSTARITCRVCLEDFQTTINLLSEPLDVYNDWIDACENAN
ncbi:Transcription elongation factor 1 like protein [Atta colombica]|uniref:Transcription elongation factor 1 homolog n=1 Tax=Atta colombica TaxID=520822 RepID=A0A195ATM0_9HYME|nr:Transcription elongation factor 1 like protein [Atta colombica]